MSNLPTTRTALELLSLKTQEITDADLELIIIELRRKREAFLKGTPDKPLKKAKEAKAPVSEAAKKAASLNLLAGLKLDLGDKK